MNRHPTASTLDAAIARMRGTLELGRWPTGRELTDEDRRIIEYNLEGAKRDRDVRRAREARNARA